MAVDVVILAAGQGSRMRSDQPKVLHRLAGKPLLGHVLDTAAGFDDVQITVVIGHGADKVRSCFSDRQINWVEQAEQLGTAHAVEQALPCLRDGARTLILYGDVPLIAFSTLQTLVEQCEANTLALLTALVTDPGGYGRIVRGAKGAVEAIVEHKDATPDQLEINEINTGVMCVGSDLLRQLLPKIGKNNAQEEYYLTDLISLVRVEGKAVVTSAPASWLEIEGINTRAQLAALERAHQKRIAESLMAEGVSFADPARFDCRGSLSTGTDVFIDINSVFEGDVQLGSGAFIGPNCHIANASIGEGVVVKANTVIEGTRDAPVMLANDVQVGPFARLREGTRLAAGVRIGNFVETKKSQLGAGSKANHLAYLGDADIGAGVNIGAGTITCNYDGVNKHRTEIEDGAFIGSNSSLVAPLSIGKDATVGAGSTIAKTVPPKSLSVARGAQRNIQGWKRPQKKSPEGK